MSYPTAASGSPNRRGDRLRVGSSEGRRALRLIAAGLVFAVVCMVLNAWVDVSIGRLHVIAALALVGLLVAVAGGVLALIAVARHGERSGWVLGAFALSLVALVVIVMQFAFDVP